MIRKLIQTGVFLKPNLMQIQKLYFSSRGTIPTTNYPYVFGGLKNVKFQSQSRLTEMLVDLLGPQTLIGFKEAYKSLVSALAQHDLNFIKDCCENNLHKNLTFQNVKLLNPDAQISFVEGKCFYAVGLNFDRAKTSELVSFVKFMNKGNYQRKKFKQLEHSSSYIAIDIAAKMDTLSVKEVLQVPLSIGIELIFKSKMKLITINENPKLDNGSLQNQSSSIYQGQELHSVQFELYFVPYNLSMWTLTKTLFYFLISRDKWARSSTSKQFMKQLIGENYQWRVGDIDRVLNRNLNIIDK